MPVMFKINLPSIRRIKARLLADPEIRAIIARNNFVAAASSVMVLNLNSRSEDYRHRIAAQWCEARAEGRWRRRIVEREGHAVLDQVHFEFEGFSDQEAFAEWRRARGW